MKKITVIGLLLSCLLGLSFSIDAQAQTPPLSGLDILFVVDQSGSMGGTSVRATPNDPNQLRFYAPIHAMRWLGSDRLQVHTTMTYRMAVVHFGDRVQVGLDWQTITPATAAAWEEQKTQLGFDLAFENLRTSSLGGTNFQLALQQARRMFDLLPSNPDAPHRQALIILTDGEPSVPGQTPSEHMQQVKQYMATNFPEHQFTTCVIAMNDIAGDYWTSMAPFWETITQGCAVKVVSNESDVGAAFRDILRDLTQDLPRPYLTQTEDVALGIPTQLIVPPYLQSIAFTLDKVDPAKDKLSIEVLEGEALNFGTAQTQVEGASEPIETITIYDPPPGRWQIKATEGATLERVDMRKIMANSVLVAPASITPVNIPTQIIYQLQSGQGRPLPVYTDPRYQLQVRAEIVTTQQSWPLALTYDPTQQIFIADFTPVQEGQYSVKLSASSQDIDGQNVAVFPFSEVGSFMVGKPTLTPLIDLPSTQTLFAPRPLAYIVAMTGETETTPTALLATATFTAGSQTWDIPLSPDVAGNFKVQFIPVAAGLHQGVLTLFVDTDAGQRIALSQESLSPFEVIAPTAILEATDLTQHCTGDITLLVNDGLGENLAVPSGYTLSAEVRLTDGSSARLTTADDRRYTGQITSVQDGSQAVELVFKTQDNNGRTWLTSQQAIGHVNIGKSTGLRLEILSPPEDVKMSAQTLQLETLPLTVTLAIQDEAGNAVAPNTILPNNPIALTVLDKDGVSIPIEVQLTQTTPGQFLGIIEGAGVGTYSLMAEITGQPVCGYHVIQPGQVIRHIHRSESMLVTGLKISVLLMLLALIVGGFFYMRRIQQQKAHPCKGRVVILDNESGDYVMNIIFPTDRHRRNRFVYKGKSLGAKAQGYLSKVMFTCSNQEDSDRGIVNVHILDLGGEEVLDTELRPSPSGRSVGKKIRKTKLYVYKDPMDR